MPALGQRFRAAREARGLTLPEVAEQVRIRSVYLAAIEDEDWDAIGAPVYVRGFLRTYARFLGLDAEEVVAAFNLGEGERGAIVPARGNIADIERAGGRRGLQLSPLIWIASLVAVILVAFVVYNELTLPRHGGPIAFLATPVPATPTPLPTAGASTTPTAGASTTPTAGASAMPSALPVSPSGVTQFALRFTGLCWARITADGAIVAQGTFPAGVTKAFSGRSVTLVVGNAGAVDLTVDGKDFGKMGAPGQVIQRSFAFPASEQ
jgi:cytoskeleton protein RodZ